MLPVILSGGSGTRLWPLSTPSLPKQFLNIVGNTSMIEQTISRVSGISYMSSPLVICNKNHEKLVKEKLSKTNDLKIMLEPYAKNTAPAILASAFYCEENEKDGIMLVLPSDHAISNISSFRQNVKLAHKIAKKNKYALFGVNPTHPETGYGYIETERTTQFFDVTKNANILKVKAFKEKPDVKTAKRYITKKNYFWNSGMFAIPAKLFIQEMQEFENEMFVLVKKSYEKAKIEKNVISLGGPDFKKISGTSIDYAVMEKTKNAYLLPLSCKWNDVGSWNAVWELANKDKNGNATNTRSFFYEAKNNLVRTKNNVPVALLGLDDCIILESDKGFVVAKKDFAGTIKETQFFFGAHF
ncbi:MAG: mannose-1-phosphate guanylyltransferase [Treponema sp.]|nr:mannose-1-phosphate guanylyltransferase [Treponema sp.]